MKIACIGGGPAGLYLGILVKRAAPEHQVVVLERNRPADTFGFGVVFSDATLGHLAAADPESHAAITSRFARWDDIEVHFGGDVLRSTGHGFCGLERKALLQILQARAAELGLEVRFEHEVRSLDDVRRTYAPDLIVACDGVASATREALAAELLPSVDVRPNKFVWLGCTVPYRAFTFLFKTTPHGMFRVHAYRFHEAGSTFIVECREDTWRRAGLADADEERTVEILEAIFADELAGHRLIKNRSIWRNFPTVRCGRWHTDDVVLLGDAAHTAHFSIGSGTKLAMEDAIVLRDELLAGLASAKATAEAVPAALAAYEAKRRPEVEALQAAAQASLEWFEGTERYARMAPAQFTYSLMTRSLRVSHASVAKRDPHLARGVERLLAASVGIAVDQLPPTALPLALGDRRARNRLAVAPRLAHLDGSLDERVDHQLVALGGAALAGAGVVVTDALPLVAGSDALALAHDDHAVAWRRVVDYVHARGALIVARLDVRAADAAALIASVQRAAFAGFDVLLLDPSTDAAAREALPATVFSARSAWRDGGWIAAALHDGPAALGAAAQVVRAGANLLWVSAAAQRTHGARLPAAPLADRLRNELGVATALEGDAVLPDLDAAIAAGRADLVVVRRLPEGTWRAS